MYNWYIIEFWYLGKYLKKNISKMYRYFDNSSGIERGVKMTTLLGSWFDVFFVYKYFKIKFFYLLVMSDIYRFRIVRLSQ